MRVVCTCYLYMLAIPTRLRYIKSGPLGNDQEYYEKCTGRRITEAPDESVAYLLIPKIKNRLP